METIHKLTQDNGVRNKTVDGKISVSIPDSHLPRRLKQFFGWRKDLTISRLSKQGSTKYDTFIEFLWEQGY